MEAQQKAIAEQCLAASYEGSMAFPDIVDALIKAGFEAYHVDFRRGVATYYLPDGDTVAIGMPASEAGVAAEFHSDRVEAAVREAQANAPGYTYAGFCKKVKAGGCAGYLVSFLGRRVIYYGRTAEVHVEHFPR